MKETLNQRRKGKISRISLLMVALIMMFAIAGCGDKNDSKRLSKRKCG